MPRLDPLPTKRHSVRRDRARRLRGADMRKRLILLGLIGLMAAGLGVLTANSARAWIPSGIGAAPQHQSLVTKVLVWKDCQEIALCTGCAPVYKCRSCSYRRTCI